MELLQSDHMSVMYFTLSLGAGLDYGYFTTTALCERAEGDYGPSENDYRIDEAGFAAALEKLKSGH